MPVNPTSLHTLPSEPLQTILTQLTFKEQDALVRVSKHLNEQVGVARCSRMAQIAGRLGRFTQTHLPTSLELHAEGIARPNLHAIMKVLAPDFQLGPNTSSTHPQHHMLAKFAEFEKIAAAGWHFETPVNSAAYLGQKHAGRAHGFGVTKQSQDLFDAGREKNSYHGMHQHGRISGYGIKIKQFQNVVGIIPFKSVEEGHFLNNQLHGPGIRVNQITGARDEGAFQNNVLIQGHTEHFISHDALASGPVVNRQLHGQVNVRYTDGQQFTGVFVNGEQRGRGTMIRLNQVVTEGEFQNFRLEGQGSVIHDNWRNEGEFRNHQLHGQGRIFLQNRLVFSGNFEEGMAQGKGEIWLNEQVLFKGHFQHDFVEGEGEIVWPNEAGALQIRGDFRSNKSCLPKTANGFSTVDFTPEQLTGQIVIRTQDKTIYEGEAAMFQMPDHERFSQVLQSRLYALFNDQNGHAKALMKHTNGEFYLLDAITFFQLTPRT